MGVILRLRERRADKIALLHDSDGEADELKDGVVGARKEIKTNWHRFTKEKNAE